MANHTKKDRKAYAMRRMAAAINRAIAAGSDAAKEQAARWATAWGALGGIRPGSFKTLGIRLRRSDLLGDRRVQPR